MLTVLTILALTAFVVTVVSTSGKCPLWPAVVILTVIELLRVLPLGK